jgi:hypothetical protein
VGASVEAKEDLLLLMACWWLGFSCFSLARVLEGLKDCIVFVIKLWYVHVLHMCVCVYFLSVQYFCNCRFDFQLSFFS